MEQNRTHTGASNDAAAAAAVAKYTHSTDTAQYHSNNLYKHIVYIADSKREHNIKIAK